MSPRRGAGEGNIQRLTLRSGARAYRGWLTVGYRPDGRPIRRTVQRATRRAVQDELVRMRERYRVGLDLDAEVETRLHGLLDQWHAHYAATVAMKKRTPQTYAWAIDHIKRVTPGDPLVRAMSEVVCQDVMGRLPAELSDSSLRLCRTVMKNAFAQAVIWRIVASNPTHRLDLPRREREPAERRTVNAAEAARLLRELAGERLGLGVALTYAIAARPGEVAAIRRADVDMDAGTVTIRAAHNKVGKQVEREETKNRRVRTLRVPPELRPWLARQLNRVVSEWEAMGARWTAPDEGLLFVRETDGGRLHGAAFYQAGRRVAERLGLGSVGPRVLRRSMLSALAAAGVDPKVRAAIGGHTEAITERHYHEVDPARVDEAMGKLKIEGLE